MWAHVFLMAWMSGQSIDLATTMVAKNAGAQEANILASPYAKGAIAAGGGVVLLNVRKTHPKLAWSIVAASIVANGYVAKHNLDVARALNGAR
jgi:uncharacterized membrane protein YebE (DUF533 family)